MVHRNAYSVNIPLPLLRYMNPSKKAYIETFGCQMNERDSEIMGQMLANVDYSPTRDIKQADVIVINTCSIREKAEQKVYSLLGRIRKLKEEKPSLIISVAGCVAQQEGERLQARMEHVCLLYTSDAADEVVPV